MFTIEIIKISLFLFLTFCVVSSKSLIIYNEEILVALSFFAFIVFCFNYFGDTIKESLSERADTIRGELQNFLYLKEESLQKLYQEHKRIRQLKSILPTLGRFTQQELSVLSLSGVETLNFIFAQQAQQKLALLFASKSTFQQRLQKFIVDNIKRLVLLKFKRKKGSKKKQRARDIKKVKKSITLLR